MKKRTLLMMSLFLASCASGDFCDLATPMVVDDIKSAAFLVKHERELVVNMNVHNDLLSKCP